MKIKLYLLLSILVILSFLGSCRRNSQDPLWNVDLLTPLVKASLSMNNIIKDTSFIKKNSDNSITVVSRQELAKITLDSLVTLTTPPFSNTVKLNSLVLDTRSVTTKITVALIISELEKTGDPNDANTALLLRAAAMYNIPINSSLLPGLKFLNVPIDITQIFSNAQIATGNLSITITNNLPVSIDLFEFNLKNKVAQNSIMSSTFNSIPANGGSVNASQNLAGMYLEGDLVADIDTINFNSTGNVYIQLDQSLDITLTVSGVTLTSANAVFPDQDVAQNSDEVSLVGLANGVELTSATIESGLMKVEVYSTAQDKIYFTYSVPSAIKGGQPFEVETIIPAALPGQTAHKIFTYDFSGYTMDLTGENNDTVNTFFNTLVGKIKYSGKKVYLSLADSISISIFTENLKPSYVKGYLGQQTEDLGPAITSLDIFKNIESGTLNFEKVNLNLTIENGFGVDGSVQINNITAYNTRTSSSQVLTGPNIGVLLPITKATDNPYVNAINTFDMSTSSNATNLINILPDKINYSIQVKTNPAGNLNTYNDFAYGKGFLSAFLDVEMPLSLIASKLVLSDTVDFNTTTIKSKNVQSGTFSVFVNNGFPLSASLKMYFMNANGMIIDSLKSSNGAILPAPVNGANKVTEKSSSQIKFGVDEYRMNNIYNTEKVIFKIEFTTEPSSTFLKIYNDYSIDFKMVGDMDYAIHKK